MKKLLLCRPQGGLNDILCQIEKCCRYAEQTDRTVIVDTNYRNSLYFGDHFGRYFVSRQSKFILNADNFSGSFDRMQVFPEFLSGRVSRYTTTWDTERWNWRDSDSAQPVTFDFSKSYPQELLVHHQSGGGSIAQFALLRMRLEDSIVDELARRVRQIGTSYSAIHVRHTDYTTIYEPTLLQLGKSPVKRLFVATDNGKVLDDFRLALGRDRVFSFATLPSSAGEPLHNSRSPAAQTYAKNRDSILDLLMLALSNRLYILKVEPNKYGVTYSGFSALAHNLWSAKIILKHLISRPDIGFGLD